MKYIFKRELWAYFTLPTGYIFLGISFFVTGMMFVIYNLIYGIGDFLGFFQNIQLIFLLLVPILTMRLFSEDKKSGTEQLLYTSPLSAGEVTCGKFLAAVTVFFLTVLYMSIFAVVLARYTKIQPGMTAAVYIGFFLQGTALISAGTFISALSENQMTAAIVSFFVMLLFYLSDWIASAVRIGKLLAVISPISRYASFSMGILDIPALVYYLTFTALCLIFTETAVQLKRS